MKQVFIGLFLAFLPYSLLGQFYPTKTYSTVEGLPSNAVFDIAQTPDRVMWFLTSEGIATYNSYKWNVFPDSLGLPISEYSFIRTSKDGTVWAAGHNEKYFVIKYYQQGVWRDIPLPKNWSESIRAFTFNVSDNNGETYVWLGNKNQILRYSETNKEWSNWTLKRNNLSISINSIVEGSNQTFICTTNGIFEVQKNSGNNEIVYSELNKKFSEEKNILIVKEKDGVLYVLGHDWLGEIDNNTFKLLSNSINISQVSIPNKYNLEVDQLGRVFYSSASLARMFNRNKGIGEPLLIGGRLKNVLSNRIFVDQENIIWVSDHRGLFKFNMLRFKNYNNEAGLIADEVSAIAQLSDGSILMANPEALNIVKNSGVENMQFKVGTKTGVARILDIQETDNGSIYIATSNRDFLVYKENKVSKVKINNEPLTIIALTLSQDKLYAASSRVLYALDKNENLEKIKAYINIRNIKSLPDDRLVLLTSNGLYIRDGENESRYSSESRLLNNTYDITKWNGDLIVATAAGVGVLKNGEIEELELKGMENKAAYALLVDRKNNLWIGTNDGVISSDGENYIHFNTRNGLAGNDISRNALIEDNEGRVWIGTDQGASVFDESENVTGSYIPKINFVSINTIKGTNIDPTVVTNLSSDDNSLEFSYAAISFINEDSFEYRYKLEGFDKDWEETGSFENNTIRYTNLPNGKYTFSVKARVESGPWSEAISVTIFIEKPFYFQIWFIALSIIIIVFCLYTFYRIRFFLLVKQKQKLKLLVKERTNEIDQQNRKLNIYNQSLKEQKEALEVALNALSKTQTKLIQSEKMAALGVLTAGVAHEINNPMNYIKSGAEILKMISKIENNEVLIQDKETYEQVMDGINIGVERIVSITKSLGSFSRKDDRLDSKVNINKVLKDTVTILHHEYKERINVLFEFDSKHLYVSGNESKLYQVFTNLLINAIHSIENEGTIKIETKSTIDKALIIIEDTGCGIPEEILGKIYDPFFTTKEAGKGTGLGLSIVYNIIEEHRGNISFQSSEKKGTIVTVELELNLEAE
tara:strand:+ start:15514 stop:18639 length:3126 start_codon:yes stop_codon:yes gene_type:complete